MLVATRRYYAQVQFSLQVLFELSRWRGIHRNFPLPLFFLLSRMLIVVVAANSVSVVVNLNSIF